MTVKFNHYWTVIPGKNEAYKKFILDDFIPTVNKLGMHAVAGWTVLVGAYTEMIFESVTNDLELLEVALRDDRYRQIKANLLNHVHQYKTKVLVRTGEIDSYSTDFREDTVKFNQMWDISIDKKNEYSQFTKEHFYPALESLGITVASEWEVLIGDGPHIMCEGRANDVSNLITNLQSKKFRRVRHRLKDYVENYQSRVLSFHIQKVKGYKSASYRIITE
jgi:hypothetical protein